MDGDGRRFAALVLAVCFVVVLTGIVTWGVLHKINKKLVEPGVFESKAVGTVVTTQATQKAN